MREFDLIVIGAGAAGLSVTAAAARLGARVALIERDRMGGDCLNTGCVPSKALLAAARHAAALRAAPRFGIAAGAAAVDFAAVRAHVGRTIGAIAPNDSAARYAALGAVVIAGEARFAGPDTVAVEGTLLRGRRIVIAAGSRPALPAIPGLDAVPHFTSETIWQCPTLPRHLIVIGGGPMGLELALAHRRLGAAVTVLEAGRMLGREDPELAEGALLALAAEGIVLREGVRIARLEAGEGGIVAVLATAGGEERLEGSHLLLATGRRPDLAALDCDRAGIATTPEGVRVDRGLRSVSNRRVYAIGDVADIAGLGPQRFTHAAAHHAEVVIRSALFRLPARITPALPRVTFLDPELAQVGPTEAEARAAGRRDLLVLRWPVAETDRAAAEGVTQGLVKVVADRRGRVLGAGILAPAAGEMIGLWALAIAAGVPLSRLAGLVLPYPTFAEASRRAAAQAVLPRLLSPAVKRIVALLGRFG